MRADGLSNSPKAGSQAYLTADGRNFKMKITELQSYKWFEYARLQYNRILE